LESGKENVWQPLKPDLVVEVSFDHVSSRSFRHGTSSSAGGRIKRPNSAQSISLLRAIESIATA
jgi:ATP-dependent DNA ligase